MREYHNRNSSELVYDAMHSSIQRIGIIQTNLENVNTVGYKAINPDSVLFSDMLKDMFRDDEQGSLISTKRPLDLALSGEDAYFLIEGMNGVERTRDGQFHINPEGKIVNHEGKELVILDKQDPDLKINSGQNVEINNEGQIRVDDVLLGRIAVDYENKQPGYRAYISQGKLEVSNVDIQENLMKIVQVKRHVDTLQGVMVMGLAADKSIVETYGKNV